MYAIGLVAMMSLREQPQHLPIYMLLRGIATETVVHTKPKHFDLGAALLVRDDVTPERWQAIVQICRKKFTKSDLPLYERHAGRWRYAKVTALPALNSLTPGTV
ncbi:MAG: hypothetical protein GWN58_07360 [Anaerolineae bacterium]|nr:hypothetical protein [Anaerolineae bacterium]